MKVMMKGNKGKGFKEAAGLATGRGFVGDSIAATIGNKELAESFGAIAIVTAPVVVAKVAVGMVTYGTKKLFR